MNKMTGPEAIFQLQKNDRKAFADTALSVYRFQYENNSIYRDYCRLTGRTPDRIGKLDEIPYLPISFFKSHEVKAWEKGRAEAVFKSSGTGNQIRSHHWIKDLSIYERSFTRGFQQFYDAPSAYRIFALLPSYIEQGGSSLVYMSQKLIEESSHKESGFFLRNFGELAGRMEQCEKRGQKALLLGVSYALLDFAEAYPMQLCHTTVMETGGMKGRRAEMSREHLHGALREAFQLKEIHSEYGMSELLSQAYSQGGGLFRCPTWMQVSCRDMSDPFSPAPTGKTGGLNIIDLANYWSCSFIETQDLGRCFADGTFRVEGRFDQSDLRGCNLMYP